MHLFDSRSIIYISSHSHSSSIKFMLCSKFIDYYFHFLFLSFKFIFYIETSYCFELEIYHFSIHKFKCRFLHFKINYFFIHSTIFESGCLIINIFILLKLDDLLIFIIKLIMMTKFLLYWFFLSKIAKIIK
jgi:hypothetical protein